MTKGEGSKLLNGLERLENSTARVLAVAHLGRKTIDSLHRKSKKAALVVAIGLILFTTMAPSCAEGSITRTVDTGANTQPPIIQTVTNPAETSGPTRKPPEPIKTPSSTPKPIETCLINGTVFSKENMNPDGSYKWPKGMSEIGLWTKEEEKGIVDGNGNPIFPRVVGIDKSLWAIGNGLKRIKTSIGEGCGYASLYIDPKGNVVYATDGEGKPMFQPDGNGQGTGIFTVSDPGFGSGEASIIVGEDERPLVWRIGDKIVAKYDAVRREWQRFVEVDSNLTAEQVANQLSLPGFIRSEIFTQEYRIKDNYLIKVINGQEGGRYAKKVGGEWKRITEVEEMYAHIVPQKGVADKPYVNGIGSGPDWAHRNDKFQKLSLYPAWVDIEEMEVPYMDKSVNCIMLVGAGWDKNGKLFTTLIPFLSPDIPGEKATVTHNLTSDEEVRYMGTWDEMLLNVPLRSQIVVSAPITWVREGEYYSGDGQQNGCGYKGCENEYNLQLSIFWKNESSTDLMRLLVLGRKIDWDKEGPITTPQTSGSITVFQRK